MLRRASVGVQRVDAAAQPEFLALALADPIVNAAVIARFRTPVPRAFGGDLLAVRDAEGTLSAAALHAGNLLPVGGGPEQWRLLAAELAGRRRICTSIVGRRAAVAEMWPVLAPAWGPARAIRTAQPLLILDRAAAPARCDPRVRRVRPAELDAYLPAAAAMFAEELGIAPERSAGVREYRRRLAALIDEGRAFGLFGRDGEVIFKADIGAASPHTCQVHGVWVRPDRRGQGIAGPALASVVRHALTLAPTVSLYVNDFNIAARRLYARLGFRETAVLSTVLF